MVIPLPAVSVGPVATDYALGMRNWLWFLSFLILLCSMLQMFLFLNIIGGFMMLVIATVGFYTIRDHSVDMNCLMSWGMICLINGVFDTVILIDKAVKMPGPMFSTDKPFLYNFIHALILLGPLSELLVSILTYRIYKDATDNFFENNRDVAQAQRRGENYGGTSQNFGSGAVGGGEAPTSSYPHRNDPTAPASQTFTPFSGQGNTLGEERI